MASVAARASPFPASTPGSRRGAAAAACHAQKCAYPPQMRTVATLVVTLSLSGPAFAGTLCIVDKKGQRTCTEQVVPGSDSKAARPAMRFILKDIRVKPAQTPTVPAPRQKTPVQ